VEGPEAGSKNKKILEAFTEMGTLRHEKIILNEIQDILRRLPVTRAITSFLKTVSGNGLHTQDYADWTDENVQQVVDRYLQNINMVQALGETYGFQTLFIWQPVPYYQYELGKHLFYAGDSEIQHRTVAGYMIMQEMELELIGRVAFLNLSKIQDTQEELLYLDAVHYTPFMNNLMATEIGTVLWDNWQK
jgi:hypothetical protein